MKQFVVHPKTYIGTVALTVSGLERSLKFYKEAIGLKVHKVEEDLA